MSKPNPPPLTLSRSLLPIAIFGLIWGANWPILKLAVTEIPPFTFRLYTLGFAGIALLAIARASGERIWIPRSYWGVVVLLACFNIAAWNGIVLFGLRELPAGRSAILAYTMPVWATLISLIVLHEPLSKRKLLGLVLGMCGMAVLISEDFAMIANGRLGTLLILSAAVTWGIGTVLIRKLKPSLPQNTMSGWMMLIGWIPLALAAPPNDPNWLGAPLGWSKWAWFAILYNIFFAGTLAHWAWFTMARRLPVAVSSLSTLPVPVVGVFSGILILGERPGLPEWISLLLVMGALLAVLWPDRAAKTPSTSVPVSPED